MKSTWRQIGSNEGVIALILLIAVVGMAYPYGFPLFTPFLVICFCVLMFRGSIVLEINIGFVFLYLSSMLYLVGIIVSGQIYAHNLNDLENMLGYLLLWLMLGKMDGRSYQRLMELYFKVSSPVLTVIAVLGIYKFYMLYHGVTLTWVIRENNVYPWGSSLVVDYNFFALALLMGLLAATYCFHQASSVRIRLIYLVMALLMTTAIILSGSRRAWVVIALLGLLLLLWLLRVLLRNLSQLRRGTQTVFITFVLLVVLPSIFWVIAKSDFGSLDNYRVDQLTYRLSTLFTDEGDSFSERSARWNYTLELLESYNFLQLVLGHGFNYLTDFANQFTFNGTEDYPHNPFLSAFLYSGMVGLLAHIMFIFTACLQAWGNRKRLGWTFLGMLGISLAFCLISANSIFSINLMMILLLFGLKFGLVSSGQQNHGGEDVKPVHG